jgi:hypothetical protein
VPVDISIDVIDDEDRETPIRMMLGVRARQDSGVRDVVLGDDRAGVRLGSLPLALIGAQLTLKLLDRPRLGLH